MEPINIRRRDLLETPHTQSEADGVFSTDMVAPLESLEVTLEPKQDGSGTPAPDNVRPIIGKTRVTVLQRAKNLFDFSEPFRSSGLYYGKAVGSSIEPGSSSNVETSVNNNVITVTTKAGWNGVCYRSPDVPNGTYTLKFNITLVDWTGSQNGRDIYVVNKNNIITRVLTHTTGLVSTTTTITLTGDESAVAISLGGRSSAYGTFQISDLQLELGSTATAYTPFVEGGNTPVGKNLFNYENCNFISGIRDSDGEYQSDNNSGYTANPTPVNPSTTYTLSGSKLYSTGYVVRVYYLDENGGWISRTGGEQSSEVHFTTPSNCHFIQIQTKVSGADPSTWQLEVGSTATTYEPYAGLGYVVELPALGKNLYDCAEFSPYKQADGTYRLTGADATNTKSYFPQELVGKELVISVYLDLTKETGPTYIRLRAVINGENKNGGTVNNNNAGYSTVTVTPTSTSDYFYMTYGSNGGNYYTFSQFQVELKTGSGRTSYEPYTNTVYKGTVDIASGTLIVDKKTRVVNAIDTVLGSPKYIKSDAVDGYINVNEIYPSKGPTSYGADELMADRLNFQNKGIWATVGFPNCWTVNGIQIHTNVANDLLGITDYTQETTATAKEKLNTWLANNPVTVTIPIQPKVYQLSPTQVMSLPKDNVFLSEDGSITYATHWRHTISLPSAYQRIQYLESTGTQYINTGKIPTDNTRMQLKYYTTSTGSFYCAGARSGASTIYFAQSGATSGAKVSCTVNGTSVTAEDSGGVDFKRVSSGQLFEIMVQTNTDSTYDYSIVDYTHNKYYRTTGVSYTPMGAVSNPIYLFAFNPSYVVTGTNRCYYFKLYRDGRIILDGVPCYRKSDGVAGLYDLVTGTFFTNSGTGEFVKGPDI